MRECCKGSTVLPLRSSSCHLPAESGWCRTCTSCWSRPRTSRRSSDLSETCSKATPWNSRGSTFRRSWRRRRRQRTRTASTTQGRGLTDASCSSVSNNTMKMFENSDSKLLRKKKKPKLLSRNSKPKFARALCSATSSKARYHTSSLNKWYLSKV